MSVVLYYLVKSTSPNYWYSVARGLWVEREDATRFNNLADARAIAALLAPDEQSYRVFVAAVRKRSRRGGWSRLVPDACDVCGADATWSHPEGGLRCDYCPKPESKAATPRRGSDE